MMNRGRTRASAARSRRFSNGIPIYFMQAILTMMLSLASVFATATAATMNPVVESIRLLGGDSLESFHPWIRGRPPNEDPSGVFLLNDGILHVRPTESGYLSTRKGYSNCRLVAEFKWGTNTWGQYKEKARNSRIYIHATGPDSTNAFVPRSLQVQIAEGATGDIELARGRLTVPATTPS